VARCSESLGENERALAEYGSYLERGKDPTLVEEAKTSRVGLAARLYRGGRKQYLPILQKGLADGSKTVRYYAAFQLADLGADVAEPAVPVLSASSNRSTTPTSWTARRSSCCGWTRRLCTAARGPGHGASTRADRRRALRGGAPREATWLRSASTRSTRRSRGVVNCRGPRGLVFDSLRTTPRRAAQEGLRRENFWKRLAARSSEIVEIKGEDGEQIRSGWQ
jgi:HEAT repeat protein